MIRDVGNIELCELLETEQKSSAKYVHYTGTSASSIARAGTSWERGTEENYTMDLFLIPD